MTQVPHRQTHRCGYRREDIGLDRRCSAGDSLADRLALEHVDVDPGQPVRRADAVSGKVTGLRVGQGPVHYNQGGPGSECGGLTSGVVAEGGGPEGREQLLRQDD